VVPIRRLNLALLLSIGLHIAVVGLVWLAENHASTNHRVRETVAVNALPEGVSVESSVAVTPLPELPETDSAQTKQTPVVSRPSTARAKSVTPANVSSTASRVATTRDNAKTVVEPSERVALNEPEPVSSEGLKRAMLDATKQANVATVGGDFGSMEMLLRERRLERALTWVFPKIVSHDKSYWLWPFGRIGVARFSVELSSDGRIGAIRFTEPSESSNLKDLVARMVKYLRPGRFTVIRDASDGPIERSFELVVTHRKGVSSSEASGNLEQLGFDSPESGRPGRGFIVDTSGQQLVAELRELAPNVAVSADSPRP
jgi:hypothetical protein